MLEFVKWRWSLDGPQPSNNINRKHNTPSHGERATMDEEFYPSSRVSKAQLITSVEELKRELLPVLHQLTDAQINKTTTVQGFKVSGFSIIIHVIEHFSYHTGQISLLTKLLKDQDSGYYEGVELWIWNYELWVMNLDFDSLWIPKEYLRLKLSTSLRLCVFAVKKLWVMNYNLWIAGFRRDSHVFTVK